MKTKNLVFPLFIFSLIIIGSLPLNLVHTQSYSELTYSVSSWRPDTQSYIIAYSRNGTPFQPIGFCTYIANNNFNPKFRIIIFRLDNQTLQVKNIPINQEFTLSLPYATGRYMTTTVVFSQTVNSNGNNTLIALCLIAGHKYWDDSVLAYAYAIVYNLDDLSQPPVTNLGFKAIYTSATMNDYDVPKILTVAVNDRFFSAVFPFYHTAGRFWGYFSGMVNPDTASVTICGGYCSRGQNEYLKYGFMLRDGQYLYHYVFGSPNWAGIFRTDTSSWTMSLLTYSNNKKIPLTQDLTFTSSSWLIVPIMVEGISKTAGQNDAVFRLCGRQYLGLSSDSNPIYQAKYSTYYITLGSDTTLLDTFYIVSGNYRACGELKGYQLKYHYWDDYYASPPDIFVMGYNVQTRQYQVIQQPDIYFSRYNVIWFTTAFQLSYDNDNTIRIRYGTQPLPTYTISLSSSTTTAQYTPTTTFYTTVNPFANPNDFGYLTNVILPLTMILIPTGLLYYLMGGLGAIIGLGIGLALLFQSGYAPYSLILIFVLLGAVILMRSRSISSERQE